MMSGFWSAVNDSLRREKVNGWIEMISGEASRNCDLHQLERALDC